MTAPQVTGPVMGLILARRVLLECTQALLSKQVASCGSNTYSYANMATCCPAGSYSATKTLACHACAPGTYLSADTFRCQFCNEGKPEGGSTSSSSPGFTCAACANDTKAIEGGRICCAAGTYNDFGIDTCQDCPAGTTSLPGSASCSLCLAGYVKPAERTATCPTPYCPYHPASDKCFLVNTAGQSWPLQNAWCAARSSGWLATLDSAAAVIEAGVATEADSWFGLNCNTCRLDDIASPAFWTYLHGSFVDSYFASTFMETSPTVDQKISKVARC